jgi:hypothetical protein
MAARLKAYPPKGASSRVVTPVVVTTGEMGVPP